MIIIGVLGFILSVSVDTCFAFSSLASSFSSSSSQLHVHDISRSIIGGGGDDDGGIKIVGLPGGQVQSLPGMYVKSFRRWIVEGEIQVRTKYNTDNNNAKTLLKAVPIMGSGILDSSKYNHNSSSDDNDENNRIKKNYNNNNNNLSEEDHGVVVRQDDNTATQNDDEMTTMGGGWVNPTSTNQLWWPRDLPQLQIRPMINVLFRNGVLSYVSAGLDVRVPRARGDAAATTTAPIATTPTATTTPANDDVSTWRNHGLNSQPIAKQWTTLDVAMDKLFHIEGFIVFEGGGEKEDGNRDDDDNERKVQPQPQQQMQDHSLHQRRAPHHYDTLFPSLNVQDALQKIARFVAELDHSSPLALGFHIASIPMTKHWIDLPTNNDRENGVMKGDGNKNENDETEVVAYKIVCIATSEPFASKLLDLDENVLTITSSSVLEVDVSRISPGGDSMYLTNPYKELYLSGNMKK